MMTADVVLLLIKENRLDCVVRALAIAADITYDKAYELCNGQRNYGQGMCGFTTWIRKINSPKFKVGKYFTCLTTLGNFSTPYDRIIALTAGHVFAVIKNTVYDLFVKAKDTIVEGYFVIEANGIGNSESEVKLQTGKLVFRCPICNKRVNVEKERSIGKFILRTLSCTHVTREKLVEIVKNNRIQSLDINSETGQPYEPYPFQYQGIEFIEKGQFRVLIADEMGLGKTVQALGALSLHTEFMPALVVCKSTLTVQWMYESLRWSKLPGLIIKTGKDKLWPGFKLYLVSYDLLRRLPEDYFDSLGLRLVILDECQHIKNYQSKRTNCVRRICDTVKNVVALSGTPIKNKPSEYFPILNILRPERFRDRSTFIMREVETYSENGFPKEIGLKNPKRFFEETKDFIIRREMKEVLPDMPPLSRQFRYVEFDDGMEQAYKDTVQKFIKYMDETVNPFSFEDYSNTLAYIAKMRHICGLAKVNSVIDFLQEFCESTDRKITVFVHHLDVANLIKAGLDELKIKHLEIESKQDADEKMRNIEECKNDPSIRVLVASTLSSGEGLNLQFMSDGIMMERQWNPANESQCERRFERIGQVNKMNFHYFIAIGSGVIDEYLSKIIEQKRAMFHQAMTGEKINWNETEIIKELIEKIVQDGRKGFRR